MLSDMNPDQFGEFCLQLMRNREEALKQIIKDIDQAEKQYAGLTSVIPSLTEETSDANLRHQLKTCMQVQAQQSRSIKMLLMIALITTSGTDFQKQLADMAAKFGKGNEALHEFVKARFGNKFGGKRG
jgi:hypothetical protein